MIISIEAEPYIRNAAFAFWRAEYLSYLLLPKSRAPIQLKITDGLEVLRLEVLREADSTGALAGRLKLEQIQTAVESEMQLSRFRDEVYKARLAQQTCRRMVGTLDLTGKLFNLVIEKYRARFSTDSPLARFFEDRLVVLKQIEDSFEEAYYKPDNLPQLEQYGDWLAQLRIETNFVVAKDLKLGSYEAAFEAHSNWCSLRNDVVHDALLVYGWVPGAGKTVRWYRNRCAEVLAISASLRGKVRPRGKTPTQPTEKNAREMAQLETNMDEFYCKLLRNKLITPPENDAKEENEASSIGTSFSHALLSHRRAAMYQL